MNPYTSFWTGVTPGDGPEEFHLSCSTTAAREVLADPVGRQALHCIRCSACLNICPVYERTGGHAYQSVYPGPIGAILTPQLAGVENAPSLPYASSLCGACYEVCPVKINIPEVLIHLRGRVVREKQGRDDPHAWPDPEALAMKFLAGVFAERSRYERAEAWPVRPAVPDAGRLHRAACPGPLAGWTAMRDVYPVASQTFREWWRSRS